LTPGQCERRHTLSANLFLFLCRDDLIECFRSVADQVSDANWLKYMRILGLPEKKLQKLQKPGSFIQKLPMLRKWAKLIGELGFISSKWNYTAIKNDPCQVLLLLEKQNLATLLVLGVELWTYIGIKNFQSRFSEVSGTF